MKETEVRHVFEKNMLYCNVRGDSHIWFITYDCDYLMDEYHALLCEPFRQELP